MHEEDLVWFHVDDADWEARREGEERAGCCFVVCVVDSAVWEWVGGDYCVGLCWFRLEEEEGYCEEYEEWYWRKHLG